MATKTIAWQTDSGNIILTYQGQGDDPISVQSDDAKMLLILDTLMEI